MQYTEIYQKIYAALKNDTVNSDQLNLSARNITDAIWDMKLAIDFDNPLTNTLSIVNEIINNRFAGIR